VQAGDTLWGISMRAGESVEDLRMANCLENASLIYTGQRLYVPQLIIDAVPTYTTTSAPPTKMLTLTPTQTQKPTESPPFPTPETPRTTPTLAPTTVPSSEG
jgi:LysM repeat protein